jgi:hypothetical protein
MVDNALEEQEPKDQAPPELKQTLMAELDLMRDIVQICALYTAGFFSAIFTTLSELDESDPS